MWAATPIPEQQSHETHHRVPGWGWAETSIPSGFGGTLLAQPDVIEALLLPATPALATRPLSIPLASVFCGMQIFTQLAHFDPGAAPGFAFSRGMLLNLGQ